MGSLGAYKKCKTLLLQKHHQSAVFLEFVTKMKVFWHKYLIGPIQERTLTLATYATKPSVAETTQKWCVLRVWNENEIFWDKYLRGPIQMRTLTHATYATKTSVAEASQ